MDAFFVRNRLSAYLDGELDAGEAREVEDALKRDPEIREEFERLRMAVELLRGHGVVDAPAGFAERVAARVAAERMPSRWSRPLRAIRAEVWLVAAASLLVVGYLGLDRGPDNAAVSPVEVAKVATPAPTAATREQSLAPKPEVGDAVADNDAQEEDAPAGGEGQADEIDAAGAETPSTSGWLGSRNDGDLSKKAAPRSNEKLVPTPIPGGSKSPSKAAPGGEKEPYYSAWEKEQPAAGSEAGEPTANTGGTAPTLYSPAPFRYRLQTVDDAVLRQLAALAASLGGRLEDKNGRALTPYLMSDGDMRDVRIVVPSYNTAALAQQLRAIGEVDTIVTKDNMIVQPGTEVPVQIDVRR